VQEIYHPTLRHSIIDHVKSLRNALGIDLYPVPAASLAVMFVQYASLKHYKFDIPGLHSGMDLRLVFGIGCVNSHVRHDP
jgi:hypothetical protein